MPEDVPSALEWSQVFHDIHERLPSFRASLEALDQQTKLQTIGDLLAALTGTIFQTAEIKEQVFNLAETFGLHVTQPHFYSPIPLTRELSDRLFQETVEGNCGVEFRIEQQRVLLREVGQLARELVDVPIEERAGDYFWRNPAFPPYDASALFGMIRKYRPRTVIEVGSGYSTLISARALEVNERLAGVSAELICIEPYPMDFLRQQSSIRLIDREVQEVDLQLFSSLQAGDILFIDSTHVSKIGSDVNHLMFHVLPRLAAGVIVHFHDIFLPFEYPQFWIKERHLFWNEQYMLMAFLSMNESFRLELGTHYWVRREPEFLQACFPNVPTGEKVVGGSFWLRRVR